MLLALGLLGAAGIGGGAYFHHRKKKPAAGDPAPRSEQQRQTDAPVAKGQAAPGGGAGGNLGAVGAAAAAGAVAGGFLQSEYFDPNGQRPFTDAAAPVIGAVVAGGAVFLAGPQAVIIVPVVVIISAAIGISNAIESDERAARFDELTRQRDALLDQGDALGAWKLAMDSYVNESFVGLTFTRRSLYNATTVQTKDGASIDIRATLDAAYADARALVNGAKLKKVGTRYYKDPAVLKDPRYLKSQALGDSWADAFEGAGLPETQRPIPWLQHGALHYSPGNLFPPSDVQKAETAEARQDAGIPATPPSQQQAGKRYPPPSPTGTRAPGGAKTPPPASGSSPKGYTAPTPPVAKETAIGAKTNRSATSEEE